MSSWPAKRQTTVFTMEIDVKFGERDEGTRDLHALCVNFPQTRDLRGCLHPGSTNRVMFSFALGSSLQKPDKTHKPTVSSGLLGSSRHACHASGTL